jgi:hypothetical protein
MCWAKVLSALASNAADALIFFVQDFVVSGASTLLAVRLYFKTRNVVILDATNLGEI